MWSSIKKVGVLAVVGAMWLGVAEDAEGATLRLIRLKCLNTEDSEVDEIKIRVNQGLRNLATFRAAMRRNQVWDLNRSLTFHEAVVVHLIDEDGGTIFDPDDPLGAFTVRPVATGGVRLIKLRRYGAVYYLWYRVDP